MNKEFINFFESFRIIDTGHQLIRLGNNSDGGYLVPKELLSNITHLISVGVEDNVSFEEDFKRFNKNVDVILLDGTIKNFEHKDFTFINKNLSLSDSDSTIRLGTLIENLTTNLALQIDIEYDEWKILEDISINDLKKFDLIVIELHIIFLEIESILENKNLSPYFSKFFRESFEKINYDLLKKYSNVVKKLLDEFHIVHLHANNSLPSEKIYEINYPPLLEVSFVNKNYVKESKSTFKKLPIQDLDYPNKLDRPDIINYYPIKPHNYE